MTSAVWVHLLHNSMLWVIVPWSLNFRSPLDSSRKKEAMPNSISCCLKGLMSCIEQSKSGLYTWVHSQEVFHFTGIPSKYKSWAFCFPVYIRVHFHNHFLDWFFAIIFPDVDDKV